MSCSVASSATVLSLFSASSATRGLEGRGMIVSRSSHGIYSFRYRNVQQISHLSACPRKPSHLYVPFLRIPPPSKNTTRWRRRIRSSGRCCAVAKGLSPTNLLSQIMDFVLSRPCRIECRTSGVRCTRISPANYPSKE